VLLGDTTLGRLGGSTLGLLGGGFVSVADAVAVAGMANWDAVAEIVAGLVAEAAAVPAGAVPDIDAPVLPLGNAPSDWVAAALGSPEAAAGESVDAGGPLLATREAAALLEAAAVRLGAASAPPPCESETAGCTSSGALGLAVALAVLLLAAASCTSAGAPRRLTTVPPPKAPSSGNTKLPECSGGTPLRSTRSPMTTPRPASPPTLLLVRAEVRNR
jgi:hypothetical protein